MEAMPSKRPAVPHRRHPCNECPWRRDTPPGAFPAHRYDQLRSTAGTPGNEAPIGAPLFACHKSAPGADDACAGWLAAVGGEHLGVRLAIITGALPASTLSPGENWPELFDNFDDMAQAQAFDDQA